jgi:hypothetical protein
MAALRKTKMRLKRQRLIMSIADDATCARPFDAGGKLTFPIVRGDVPHPAVGLAQNGDIG